MIPRNSHEDEDEDEDDSHEHVYHDDEERQNLLVLPGTNRPASSSTSGVAPKVVERGGGGLFSLSDAVSFQTFQTLARGPVTRFRVLIIVLSLLALGACYFIAPKEVQEPSKRGGVPVSVSSGTAVTDTTNTGDFMPLLTNKNEIAKKQIENYRAHVGLMYNVHITHHAGTVFCQRVGRLSPAPNFACMGGDNWPEDIPTKQPWSFEETDERVRAIRKHFHMIAMEYRDSPTPPLSETDWENPRLLSVTVMRHPMDRLLAGDGKASAMWNTTNLRTPEQWWEFANHYYTDNYALRVLGAPGCCQGDKTKDIHVENAKKLLRRFTYVLDQACLDEGLTALARELGLNLKPEAHPHSHSHPSARQRIANDTLYEYLVKRNSRDIELYEWSKTISLVNCSAIQEKQEDHL